MILKSGMIGFAGSDKTFIQRAIRFFTNSDFSHSFLIVDGPDGALAALETTETVVTVTPMRRKFQESNWIEIWDVAGQIYDKDLAISETYSKYAGKWYGYLSYIWFIYRWFFRLFKIEKKKMWNWAHDGVTCSELTTTYCQKLYPCLFTEDINIYAPRELREVFKSNRNIFTSQGWLIPKDKVCRKN